jgi:sugar lactone lactonase YvrE
MPIALTKREDLALSIRQPVGRTPGSSKRPHLFAVIIAVLAGFYGILGTCEESQAQGVGGSSLGTLTVPTATPTPSYVLSPISSIYAANPTTNSLSIFPNGSSGNVASHYAQTNLFDPRGIAYHAGNLYVANHYTDSITVYPASSNGAVNPAYTIRGSSTQLNDPVAVALDSSGKIYVANRGNPCSITVYPAGSNGNVAPAAIISGASTELSAPNALTLDSQGNIYVVNEGSAAGGQDSVTVYSSGSTGNPSPMRTISGSSTGLSSPMGIAVDAGGYIYVSSGSGTNTTSLLSFPGAYVSSTGSSETNAVSILIYAPGASGNVVPTTSIDGDCAVLNAPGALALANGQLYVTNPANLASGDESVAVYNNISVAPGLPQCLTPVANIFGPHTGINQPFGIAVDPSGNIYVTNSDSNSITVFSPTANQDTYPSATIASQNSIENPTAVAVDSSGNIYVANAGTEVGSADSVTIYPPASNASAAPTRTFGGAGPWDLSQLSYPSAIAVGASRILVANQTSGYQSRGTITIYQPSLGIPSWGISGTGTGTSDQTGLNQPVAIALDSSNNVYVLNAAGGPDGAGSITVYALPTGNIWNVAPIRTIANFSNIQALTQFQSPAGMALDSSNTIYVTNDGSIGGNPDSITIYPAGSSGNVAPSAVISGSNTGLSMPQGIAIDRNGNICVANDGSTNGGIDTITVYSPGSTGNVAPIRTISGSLTGLVAPSGLAVGP